MPEPNDWVTVSKPSAASGGDPGDWQTVGAAPSEPNTLGNYASHASVGVNPINIARGVFNMIAHPVDTYTQDAQVREGLAARGKQDLSSGNYVDGAVRILNALVPLLGPQVQKAAEHVQKGELAAGLGDATGMGLGFVAPGAIAKGVGAVAGRLAPSGVLDAAAQGLSKSSLGSLRAAKYTPELVDQIAEFARKNGITMTPEGRAALNAKLDAMRQSQDAAAAASPDASISPQPSLDNVAKLRERLGKQVNPEADLGTVDNAAAEFQRRLGGQPAPPDSKILFHGTPHSFDKFDMSKVGTGEGAQAYGHGLYFAENPDVAKTYSTGPVQWTDGDSVVQVLPEKYRGSMDNARRIFDNVLTSFKEGEIASPHDYLKEYDVSPELRPAYQKAADLIASKTNLYKVAIPQAATENMLDWDKPLSEQPAALRDKIITDYLRENNLTDANLGTAYKSGMFGGTPEQSTANLRGKGISGLKYLDGGSRAQTASLKLYNPDGSVWIEDNAVHSLKSAQEQLKTWKSGGPGRYGEVRQNPGTSNYVIFDDQLPQIVKDPRNMTPTEALEMKRATNSSLKNQYGAAKLSKQVSTQAEAEMALNKGVVDQLHQQFPEIAATDKTFESAIPLKAIVRRQIQARPNYLKAAFSGDIPIIGGVNGVIRAVLSDPAIKSKLAVALTKAGEGMPLSDAVSRISGYLGTLEQAANASKEEKPPFGLMLPAFAGAGPYGRPGSQ